VAKLGSRKRPAVVRVGSDERAQEILEICVEKGWQVIVGVEEDEPEDISDVEALLRREEEIPSAPEKPKTAFTPRIGRNDYCPCASGKKYKNCCGASAAAEQHRI
jgi:SWIM/SEC-C metal-binding protein